MAVTDFTMSQRPSHGSWSKPRRHRCIVYCVHPLTHRTGTGWAFGTWFSWSITNTVLQYSTLST